MKKKIEKYLKTKRPNKPVINELGIYLIGDDVEGCLRAARQPHNAPKQKSTSDSKAHVPTHAYGPTPLAPFATPMHYAKRTFDGMMMGGGVMYSGMRFSNKRVCSESPRPTQSDLKSLAEFFKTLKGGYVDGIWLSSLERRRMAEKTASNGSTDTLNGLNLTLLERERLPRFFRNKMLDPYQIDPNITTTPGMHMMSFGQMPWGRPSPMEPLVQVKPSAAPGNIFGNLKPSPLSRSKEGSLSKVPATFMTSPGKSTGGMYHHQANCTPLASTPMHRGNDGVFTPSLFYGSTNRGWGTPSWGGDDAKILHEALSTSRPPHAAVTPGFTRITAPDRYTDHRMSRPLTTGECNKAGSTPRVAFKDDLTETYDFKLPGQASLAVSPYRLISSGLYFKRELLTNLSFYIIQSQTTPISAAKKSPSSRGVSGVVTGSGPARNRLSSTPLQDRDNLLSTAILATPKSPKYSKSDMDQSLHHIDACIKTPLDFGSPTMK